MEEDLILKSLTETCQESPEDPNARARLICYCREEGTPVSPKLLESLANLARTKEGREEVLEADLLPLLMRKGTNFEDENFLIQASRLGGNLCFDSQLGRQTVKQTGLLQALASSLPSSSLPSHSKLWQVLPAFLHNYCTDNPTSLNSVSSLLETAALRYSLLQEEDASGESWASMLAGLTEHEGKLILFTRPIVLGSVLHLLQLIREEETLQSLLDLLQDLCEDENMSSLCLNQDLLSILISIIDRGVSEELEMSCLDLLALLSSHPSALETIITPSSPLPTLLPTWLSSEQTQRAATAALIYGNYSTSDANCTLLVTSSTVPATLVTLLHPNSPVKLLHAVVGCLRNLSVCQPARELLCSLFLPQACVQLLQHLGATSDHTVTPKLVATLRLVSQGGKLICKELGFDKELLICLVSISRFSLVPALAIETARLIASLIRYSEENSILVNCLQVEGCLELLTSLFNSPHPQLINEVLVVLAISTASKPPLQSLVESLDLPFLASKLISIMEVDTIPSEIKSNALQLLYNLLQWKETSVTEILRGHQGLKEAIQRLQIETDITKEILVIL